MKGKRRPVATPDGEGRYLFRGTLIRFDLEWDRGTESFSRLRQKVRTYVGYYTDVAGADRHHILFVLSNPHRENTLHSIVRRERPGFAYTLCRFWTTTLGQLEAHGPLGPLWADTGRDPWDLQTLAPRPRLRLIELRRQRRPSGRSPNASVGPAGGSSGREVGRWLDP